MSGARTAEEDRERRKGWLTLLVVAVIAIAFFVAVWAAGVYLYLSGPTEID